MKNYWLDKAKKEDDKKKEIERANAIFMETLAKKKNKILTRYGKKR